MKKYINIIILIITIAILFSCRTTLTRLRSNDRFIFNKFISNKAVTRLTIYKDNKGKLTGVLTSPFIHWSKIKGDITFDVNGDIELDINKFYFITNWPNGFTEGEAEATGQIIFNKEANEYKTIIKEPFEILEYIKGEVRYFDDYYIDEEGLKKVSDRMNRIKELNKFIKKKNELKEFYGDINFNTSYSEAFKKSVKRFLFNKDTVYPENLIKLKESGTILRDYEESAGLIFMDYNMDYYLNKILNDSYFEIIK